MTMTEGEAKVLCITQENREPFHYCDNRIEIGGRHPSFIHETDLRVIEVYNDEIAFRPRSGQYSLVVVTMEQVLHAKTRRHYRVLGYECLCLNSNLPRERIVQALLEFQSGHWDPGGAYWEEMSE